MTIPCPVQGNAYTSYRMDEKTAEMDELFANDRALVLMPRIGCEYTALLKDGDRIYLRYAGVCIQHTPPFSAAAAVVSLEFARPSTLTAVKLTDAWINRQQTQVMIPHTKYTQTIDGPTSRYLGTQSGTHHVFIEDAVETGHLPLRGYHIDVLGFLCSGRVFDSEYYQ